MRILLVEDDIALGEGIRIALKPEGYTVDWLQDGVSALHALTHENFDLVVLDLGLPRMEGLDVLKALRSAHNPIPVLVLTARDSTSDRIAGLDAGADDYVVKPFQIEEIKARLNALLRRAAGFAKPTLDFAHLSLDTTARKLKVAGADVELTAYEYKVLEYLMLHPGKVISKTELTEHLYDQDHDRDSNVLEVFIRRLRQKLDPDETLKPIDTIRGQGYRFNVPARQG